MRSHSGDRGGSRLAPERGRGRGEGGWVAGGEVLETLKALW